MRDPGGPTSPPSASSALWVNGQRQVGGAAQVQADDRGLLLADGVFETMRGRRGRLFLRERHLARLAHALDAMAITAPPALHGWLDAAVAEAGHDDVAVRVTVTRGRGGAGVAVSGAGPATVIVAVRPLPRVPPALQQRGLRAHIVRGRLSRHAATAGLKTLAYTDTVMASLEVTGAGADEGLWLDTDGHCAEALTSNLFVWTGETLVTPPVSCGILPGITRASVLELALAQGLAVAEQAVDVARLHGAREAFLTSTLRGVIGLTQVGERTIGDGVPGPITHRLAAARAALVARELGTAADDVRA